MKWSRLLHWLQPSKVVMCSSTERISPKLTVHNGAMRLPGSHFFKPGLILDIFRMNFGGFLLLRDVPNVTYSSRL